MKTITLTEEQAKIVAANPASPVEAIDPVTQQRYLLVAQEGCQLPQACSNVAVNESEESAVAPGT